MLIRISVANLVRLMKATMSDGVSWQYVGILGASHYRKGKKVAQAIGGAAVLTLEGRELLQKRFGAENFHESGEGSIDARFEMDDSYLNDAFDFFRKRDARYFEIDPAREILEELSTVELKKNEYFPEIPAVLTPGEAASIEVKYARTVAQPFSGVRGTSTRERDGVPTHRLFHQFDIVVSPPIYTKIGMSQAIVLLDEEEMETTHGGACGGITKDGVVMSDNLIA